MDVFFCKITGSFYIERQMIWEWFIPICMIPGHIIIKKVLEKVFMVQSLSNIFKKKSLSLDL